MRHAYTLASVTRLYDAALACHVLPDGDSDLDFEILVRAEAVRLACSGAAEALTDRYEPLHDLGTHAIVDAYRAAEDLYARIGFAVPTPRAFADAGVAWEELARTFRGLALRGAEPELIVAPVLPLGPANEDGGVKSWQHIYAALAEDDTIADNPLRARADGKGLQFGSAQGVRGAVSDLHRQELTTARSERHCVGDERGTVWTVTVVALSDAVAVGNTPYHAGAEDHISPSEYLALQARRIVERKTPVDLYTWTWLRGVIDGEAGEHALAGVWVPGYGQIRLYANPVHYAHERLLTRTLSRG